MERAGTIRYLARGRQLAGGPRRRAPHGSSDGVSRLL